MFGQAFSDGGREVGGEAFTNGHWKTKAKGWPTCVGQGLRCSQAPFSSAVFGCWPFSQVQAIFGVGCIVVWAIAAVPCGLVTDAGESEKKFSCWQNDSDPLLH